MAMQKIMNVVINSCKKTSELIDEQSFRALSIGEKIQLQVHKSICKNCDEYEKHSKIIDKVIANWFGSKSKTNVKLPEERKTKIINEINEI